MRNCFLLVCLLAITGCSMKKIANVPPGAGSGSGPADRSSPQSAGIEDNVENSPVDQQGISNVAVQGVTGISYSKINQLSATLGALLMFIVYLSHRREMLRLQNGILRKS